MSRWRRRSSGCGNRSVDRLAQKGHAVGFGKSDRGVKGVTVDIVQIGVRRHLATAKPLSLSLHRIDQRPSRTPAPHCTLAIDSLQEYDGAGVAIIDITLAQRRFGETDRLAILTQRDESRPAIRVGIQQASDASGVDFH
ncbi:MAG: hypothetical protein VX205_13040 [Pseudomonadota bacterium]|nr:hypothetical protein [Pseudomonadota bacterium]